MTESMRQSIWVQGIIHLPAEHVRHFSRRNTGYIFHTELNDEDARTALFGCCPEIVRVDNGLHGIRCGVYLLKFPEWYMPKTCKRDESMLPVEISTLCVV
jgi:hypothetical protein